MRPRILQINVSSGGVPKKPVPFGRVSFQRIIGDDWNDKAHHGLPGQAILLLSSENIELLRAEGFALFPGALGENFTTQGLDFRSVRPGQVYRVGAEVLLRITKPRSPCRTISIYGTGIETAVFDEDARSGNPASGRWGRSGFYAEVLQEGTVYPDDEIALVPEGSAPPGRPEIARDPR